MTPTSWSLGTRRALVDALDDIPKAAEEDAREEDAREEDAREEDARADALDARRRGRTDATTRATTSGMAARATSSTRARDEATRRRVTVSASAPSTRALDGASVSRRRSPPCRRCGGASTCETCASSREG